MDESEKAAIKFKNSPEDFIVEEIGRSWICKVSESKEVFENSKVDFGKLDINDRRTFITCDLEKYNIDHFSAFEILGKALNKGQHELGYAGTKDKSAWSCQRISIFNPNMELIKIFSHSGIVLKNFKWAKHKINVGDLKGNSFNIILRDAGKEAIKILPKVRHLQLLPNSFGPQRFGSLRKDNFNIGRLIFKKRFEEAIWTFLTGFGENEDDEVKKAKKRLKSEKNIVEAAKYFPEKLRLEHQLLNHLSKFPKDWIGALGMIDEKTLLIIAQSVQSRIFNEILQRVVDKKIDVRNNELILPGYSTQFSEGKLGKIEAEILNEYDLEIKDFNIQEIPFLKFKGSMRKSFSKIEGIDVRVEEDELFQGSKKIILSFILDSGTYATTFLEQFFILS